MCCVKSVGWWCSGSLHGLQWTDLPFDIQLAILADIPLAELARLATLSKGMRAAYEERLKERQSCIQERLAEGWLGLLSRQLSQADMAVPRDLVVSPPVCYSLVCSPLHAEFDLAVGFGARANLAGLTGACYLDVNMGLISTLHFPCCMYCSTTVPALEV